MQQVRGKWQLFSLAIDPFFVIYVKIFLLPPLSLRPFLFTTLRHPVVQPQGVPPLDPKGKRITAKE
jgi:hypothetical protein